MQFTYLLVPLFVLGAYAQDDGLAARRLYYQDNAPETVFKATTVAQNPASTMPVVKQTTVAQRPARPVPVLDANVNKVQEIEKIQKALREAATTALTSNANSGVPVLKPASNLGVRYNILKVTVDERGKVKSKVEVPPDMVFHENDCISVRIQPNRGGFLYVFTEGPSGNFQPLIPSAEMADESNIVTAYNLMEVPQKSCLTMDDQPGIERLLFVVTDKPEDVMKLNDILKKKSQGNMAVAKADMTPFTAALQSRDLKVTHYNHKADQGESPYTTYLTNAAATTADRLVLEIKLKHEK